jgi:hypothetical protein
MHPITISRLPSASLLLIVGACASRFHHRFSGSFELSVPVFTAHSRGLCKEISVCFFFLVQPNCHFSFYYYYVQKVIFSETDRM